MPTSTAGGDSQAVRVSHPAAARSPSISSAAAIDAEVQFGALPGLHRIVHRVDPSTTVDLVLAVDDARGLAEAAASWLAQPHPSWNVVLAAPDRRSLDAAMAALTAAGIPEHSHHHRPTDPGDDPTPQAPPPTPPPPSTSCSCRPPPSGLTHDWLTRLLGYSAQPGIAAAGPVAPRPRRPHPTSRHRHPRRHPPAPPLRLRRGGRALRRSTTSAR